MPGFSTTTYTHQARLDCRRLSVLDRGHPQSRGQKNTGNGLKRAADLVTSAEELQHFLGSRNFPTVVSIANVRCSSNLGQCRRASLMRSLRRGAKEKWWPSSNCNRSSTICCMACWGPSWSKGGSTALMVSFFATGQIWGAGIASALAPPGFHGRTISIVQAHAP